MSGPIVFTGSLQDCLDFVSTETVVFHRNIQMNHIDSDDCPCNPVIVKGPILQSATEFEQELEPLAE